MRNAITAAAVGGLLLLGAEAGHAFDLHAFWDSRCHECHGHAGAFARKFLKAENGVLVGRHHKNDLARFLGQHEMGPAHVDGIYAMLLAQASTPPLFQQKCARCHGTAAELARASLVRQDGAVVGRASRKELSQFLQGHGGLQPGEIGDVVASLSRVLRETGQVAP